MAGVTFHKTVLPNGLTVIGELNSQAASCSIGYFVRAGSRDELPAVAGVSHFLEHMLFKGNDRYSADDLNRMFDELGADYNAFTSDERTVYYGAVTADRWPRLLALLTELLRPALRQADFDLEKNVILEEIAMYQDRPADRLFEVATERFWAGHPLGHSVLGSTESVSGLSRDQMLDYYSARYAAGNIVLAATGRFDWEALVEQVAAATHDWRDFEVGREVLAATTKSGHDRLADDSLKRAHFAVLAPGVGAESASRYAASTLATAIGDSSGSRLYWALLDKGLADAASLSHAANEGAGAFVGYLSAAPERADEVLRTYLDVLAEVQRSGPTEAEWERAKRKIATASTFRSETPAGRLVPLGAGYQVRGEYVSVQEAVRRISETRLQEGLDLLALQPFGSAYVLELGPAGG